MLNKILKSAVDFFRKNSRPFDPSVFHDEVALKTKWSPLVPGGASFSTRGLIQADLYRLEFKMTLGMKLFCSVFCVFGIFFPFGIVSALLRLNKGLPPEALFALFIPLIFLASGIFMFRSASMPIAFDKRNGYFWKGWEDAGTLLNGSSFGKGVRSIVELNKIYALQIVSEHCTGRKSSYYSYELNLVLEDGDRVNVIDHGVLEKLRKDANTLAQFLGVRVWDVTDPVLSRPGHGLDFLSPY